jgi:hypothetical protein
MIINIMEHISRALDLLVFLVIQLAVNKATIIDAIYSPISITRDSASRLE